MHNLLPPDYKRSMRSEYRTRWVVVVLVFTALTGVVAFMSLIPSYILSFTKYQAIQQQRDTLTSTLKGKNEKETLALLETAKKKMDWIEKTEKGTSFTGALEKLLGHRRKDIRIVEIRFGNVTTEGRAVSLVGIAASREALVQFTKTLQSDKTLSNVNLPISNLAEREDISFSLELRGKF